MTRECFVSEATATRFGLSPDIACTWARVGVPPTGYARSIRAVDSLLFEIGRSTRSSDLTRQWPRLRQLLQGATVDKMKKHYLWELRPYFRQMSGQLILGSIFGIIMNIAVVLPAILLGRLASVTDSEDETGPGRRLLLDGVSGVKQTMARQDTGSLFNTLRQISPLSSVLPEETIDLASFGLTQADREDRYATIVRDEALQLIERALPFAPKEGVAALMQATESEGGGRVEGQ